MVFSLHHCSAYLSLRMIIPPGSLGKRCLTFSSTARQSINSLYQKLTSLREGTRISSPVIDAHRSWLDSLQNADYQPYPKVEEVLTSGVWHGQGLENP